MKFGTPTPIGLGLRAASLEKLRCHVDLPHISSIALLFFLYLKWSYLTARPIKPAAISSLYGIVGFLKYP